MVPVTPLGKDWDHGIGTEPEWAGGLKEGEVHEREKAARARRGRRVVQSQADSG